MRLGARVTFTTTLLVAFVLALSSWAALQVRRQDLEEDLVRQAREVAEALRAGIEPLDATTAAQRLKDSKMAREYFGDEFVDHFAATREWEEREFRKAITDWELRRYFEII